MSDAQLDAMENREREAKQRALAEAHQILHSAGFDAFIILVSYMPESGGTSMLRSGAGNWYAQNGMIDYFLALRTQDAMDKELGDEE